MPDSTLDDAPGLTEPDDADASTPTTPVVARLRDLRRPAVALVSLSWVPLAASAFAVILSVASIWVSTREPEVVVILPDVVRLVGGHATGSSYVYLQPAYVSTGVNDRIEVIADMTLVVQREDGSDRADLEWREQASLVTGPDGALSYQYESDAVPLLVGPRSAATPLALFQAPPGWFFREGTYRFTLEADRVVSAAPLRTSFEVTLAAGDMAVLDATGPERFLAFSIDERA